MFRVNEWKYGKVYHGVMGNGQAAVFKKLDANKQLEQEFLEQVSRHQTFIVCNVITKSEIVAESIIGLIFDRFPCFQH